MNSAIVNSSLVVAATLAALLVVFHPRLVKSSTWRATVTPLASIIGSGFLVLGPILKHDFGSWGILVMMMLCGTAYLFGSAIRFNIAQYDDVNDNPIPTAVKRLERIASYALAAAYVISIAYYLNLFGAFAVSLTSSNDQTHARIVTSAALFFVAGFGWLRGFAVLERIEEGTVGVKLSIIVGLLVALVAFFLERLNSDEGLYFSSGQGLSWQSVAIALGLVITVQGFETSRYLGNEFDAKTRMSTMKLSQWISTAIYIVYICLVTFCFTDDQVPESETGIIGMTDLVAPVLPAMLVAAALAAQFSAAVADTGGCGGLAEEVTHGRVKAKTTYLLIGAVGIGLTWVADIYSIIAYASRAFAIYYALQCAIASTFAMSGHRDMKRIVWFGMLAVVAATIVVFGRSAE